MRVLSLLHLPCLATIALLSPGPAGPQPPPASVFKFATGFWFWTGSSANVTSRGPRLDVLFVQVGTIQKGWGQGDWEAYAQAPKNLPPARDYWLVFRAESEGVPTPTSIARLAERFAECRAEMAETSRRVAGLQLDIDSPTADLAAYAAYLREVRKAIGPDAQLSVTALLDWFRPGTEIAQVVQAVDEFVPQFYDVENPSSYRETRIAAPVSAAKWSPVFNQFRKRYRIGLATFGRSRLIPRPPPPGTQLGLGFGPDPKPLELALNPAIQMESSTTPAKEILVRYRLTRKTRIQYSDRSPGDAFEFVFPTAESIRTAFDQAKRMGGHCAGVVFFRWPYWSESLTYHPDQALTAAGLLPVRPPKPPAIRVVDGHCAAVACADVYLLTDQPLTARPLRYRIKSATPFDYFLPNDQLPVSLTAPGELSLALPPFCGRSRSFLGRAVTHQPTTFAVEELP